jgi:hypothetical protein
VRQPTRASVTEVRYHAGMRRAPIALLLALSSGCQLAAPTGGPEPVEVPPTDEEAALAAREAAAAIGVDQGALVDARWVLADGSPPPSEPVLRSNFHRGHALLEALGPNLTPTEGDTMLVLSSGTAARGDDPDYVHRNFDKGYVGRSPEGFPKESASCPGTITLDPFDDAGLEIDLDPPNGATGFSFDFAFLTFEWPQYICTTYNDFFVAMLEPVPAGQADGNISFDGSGNPISVNNAFLDHCSCPGGGGCPTPPLAPAKGYACSHGNLLLAETPFVADQENPGWSHGSTGWLKTTAPVEPGQTFTIRFAVYDSSDHILDSTVLVDGWRWTSGDVIVGTEPY